MLLYNISPKLIKLAETKSHNFVITIGLVTNTKAVSLYELDPFRCRGLYQYPRSL